MTKKQTIAVIGSGISGIMSAYQCDPHYDVTIIEKEDDIGGHTYTVAVDDPAGEQSIDMGFIVYNPNNYPHFCRFLKNLGVSGIESDMSFGYYEKQSNFWYCSDFPKGFFSQPKNIFKPELYRLIWDMLRFNKSVQRDYHSGALNTLSMGDYLEKNAYSDVFVNRYFIPMCSAIWSSDTDNIRQFPMASLIQFWINHQLLQLTAREPWYTVKNGSHAYLEAFKKSFKGRVLTQCSVKSIIKNKQTVTIAYSQNNTPEIAEFDHVIVATHADQALTLLDRPSKLEKKLLGSWQYSKNTVVLHSDTQVMPPNPNAWASWTVHPSSLEGNSFSMSYTMNRLQQLKTQTPYFVSLNVDDGIINEEKIHKKVLFQHPIFNQKALQTQSELCKLNEEKKVLFCGSYFGYGFHEDGARSGLEVAKILGCKER